MIKEPLKAETAEFVSSILQSAEASELPDNTEVSQPIYIKLSSWKQSLLDAFAIISKRGEKSERALTLTFLILDQFEGHYSVWQYRRVILEAIKYDLNTELLFIKEFVCRCPKNYQVWHHREAIINWIEPSEDLLHNELVDVRECLVNEPKNYHAWQYRWWLVQKFHHFIPWKEEFNHLAQLLTGDPFNNSAWHYRLQLQRLFLCQQKSKLDLQFEFNLIKTCIEYSERHEHQNLSLVRYLYAFISLIQPETPSPEFLEFISKKDFYHHHNNNNNSNANNNDSLNKAYKN